MPIVCLGSVTTPSDRLPIYLDLQEVFDSRDALHLFGFGFDDRLLLRAFDWASQGNGATRSNDLHVVGIRGQRTISNHSLADSRGDLPISLVFCLIP